MEVVQKLANRWAEVGQRWSDVCQKFVGICWSVLLGQNLLVGNYWLDLFSRKLVIRWSELGKTSVRSWSEVGQTHVRYLCGYGQQLVGIHLNKQKWRLYVLSYS